MGKNGRNSKMYGKVVSKDTSERPGWKGPGYQKPKAAEKPKTKSVKEEAPVPEEEVDENAIPLELQQLLLNIFKDVFAEILDGNELKGLLQDVKGALYERDFERAFGKKEFLEAYAVRWSPSRALCYQSILIDIQEHLLDLPPVASSSDSTAEKSLPIVCFGGGAAEVIAFGGLIKYLQGTTSSPLPTVPESSLSIEDTTDISQPLQSLTITPLHTLPTLPKLALTLLDIAHWNPVVQSLHTGLLTPPTLSKYANATARESNFPLLAPSSLSTTFRTEDVFSLSQKQLGDEFGRSPMLLTLLFTLNELYSSSIGKTTAFLLNLTAATRKGTLLLVVDSPGSYSETTVGSEAKKYPMKWLLDHALLGSKKAKPVEEEEGGGEEKKRDADVMWEKVVEEDSKWFRIPEGLRYPIPLENMRYQIHLYRRI